jgi:fibronectin type 3 domain-containing protein
MRKTLALLVLAALCLSCSNQLLSTMSVEIKKSQEQVFPPEIVLPDITSTSWSSVNLAWPPAARADHYHVYRRDPAGAYPAQPSAESNSTGYADTGLAPGSAFFYQICAVNANGEGPASAEVSAVVEGLPTTPRNLSISGYSDAAITLAWEPNYGQPGIHYALWRSHGEASEDFTVIVDDIVEDAGSYTDSAIQAGDYYKYRLTAANGKGESAPTPVRGVIASSEIPAAAPVLDTPVVTLSGSSNANIRLAWSPVDKATGYRYRRIVGGTPSADIDVGALLAYTDEARPLDQRCTYQVWAYNAAGSGGVAECEVLTPPPAPSFDALPAIAVRCSSLILSWTPVGGSEVSITGFLISRVSPAAADFEIAASDRSRALDSLSPATTYRFKIAATNLTLDEGSGLSLGGQGPFSAELSVTTAPPPPLIGLKPGTVSPDRATLSWGIVAGATGYNVYGPGTGNPSYLPAASLELGIVGLAAASTNEYSIEALSSSWISDRSATSSILTLCAAPTGLRRANADASSLTLAWDPSPGADSYSLLRGGVEIYSGGSLSHADGGLAASSEYSYELRAINASGAGPAATLRARSLPQGPTLAFAGATSSSISLSWTAPGPGMTGYRLYIDGSSVPVSFDPATFAYTQGSLAGGSSHTYQVTALKDADESAPSNLVSAAARCGIPTGLVRGASPTSSGLAVSWDPAPGADSYTLLRDETPVYTGSIPAYADSGLDAGRSYAYKVRADNASGEGEFSAPAVLWTLPAAPTLSIAGSSETSIALSWTDAGAAFSYELFIDGSGVAVPLGAGILGYLHSSLTGGTSHSYEIRARRGEDYSARSATVTGFTLSGTPQAPARSGSVTTGAMSLSWSPVANAKSYELRRDGVTIYGGASTGYDDSGLAPASAYTYQVRAQAGDDRWGDWSPAASLWTLPAAPSLSVNAAATTTSSLELSWSNVGAAFSYQLFRDGETSPVILAAGVTSYSHNSLASGSTHSYSIVACREGDSSEASATSWASTLCAAPTGLARGGSPTTASLAATWGASSGATGYVLRRSGVEVYSGSALSFDNTGLGAATSYSFEVCAVNAAGRGPWSSAVAMWTLPAAPTISVGNGLPTSSALAVSWTNAGPAFGYYLYRDGEASPVSIAAGTTSYTHSSLAGGTSHSYYVKAYRDTDVSAPSATVSDYTYCAVPTSFGRSAAATSSVTLSWTGVANAGKYYVQRSGAAAVDLGTATSYTCAGLAKDTGYTFAVWSVNAAGDASATATAVAATLPEAPALTVGTVTSGSIALSWSSTNNAGIGYKISVDGGGYVDQGTGTSYSHSGLSPGTGHSYAVIAYRGADQSSAASASRYALCAAPATPSMSSRTTSSVSLGWTGVANASSYIVRKGTSSYVDQVVGTATSYAWTGLSANSYNVFSVIAVNADGAYSAASAQTRAYTLPNAPALYAQQGATTSSITIQWSTVGTNFDYYEIYNGASLLATKAPVLPDTGSITHQVTGLAAGSVYAITVRAYKKGGDDDYGDRYSAFSGSVSCYTHLTAAPASVSWGLAKWVRTTYIDDISWAQVANAASYNVYLRVGSATGTIVSGYPKNTPTSSYSNYKATGLTAGTTYFVEVRAVGNFGGVESTTGTATSAGKTTCSYAGPPTLTPNPTTGVVNWTDASGYPTHSHALIVWDGKAPGAQYTPMLAYTGISGTANTYTIPAADLLSIQKKGVVYLELYTYSGTSWYSDSKVVSGDY